MSWKLDNISFQSYGVYVESSRGLLDLPKLDIPFHDWKDENGVEYIPDTVLPTRKRDREIKLTCLLMAGNLADAESKINTFYNVLKAEDKRSLSCDYLAEPIDVFLEKEIDVNRLTKWRENKQYWKFTLYLTVPGDSKKNIIDFKRYTPGVGTVTVAAVKTGDLKITKGLQSDVSLSLTFESNSVLDIQSGDFIQYYYGSTGEVDGFVVIGDPSYKKASTNKYQYSLTLPFHGYEGMKKSQFQNDLLETDFEFYGNIEEVFELIQWSYTRRGYGSDKYQKGTIAETERRLHKFSGEYCFDVLKRMCVEYELEYEFEKTTPTSDKFYINIKEQVANDKAVTLEYGKGNGLYELFRGKRIEDEYFTKLLAFGAAKNLPVGYRGGLRRLSFDGNPIQIEGITDDNYKEKTLYFNDIFPQRTGTVTAYNYTSEAELTDAEKETWPNGIYEVQDTSLDFDINDKLLGVPAKIVMKSGALSGFEFTISKYDHDIKTMFIIPFRDERDELLPNLTDAIAAGDTYTLVNIDMPDTYVTYWENELATKASAALAKGSVAKFEYTGKLFSEFIYDNNLYVEIGDRFPLVDTDYSVNESKRVSKLVFSDIKQEYELVFLDKKKKATIPAIAETVDRLDRAADDTGSDKVESMRDSQWKPSDVFRKLLDPLDDKLRADDVIRNNSIDPGMLAIDAGEPDFYPHNSEIIGNYEGNEDAIRVTAGKLIITNWYTKNRYEIAKMKAAGQVYDPSRSWDIPLTDITLENKNPHALYAKLTLEEESTVCEIVAFELHTELKAFIEDGYLLKRIATISAGEEAAV